MTGQPHLGAPVQLGDVDRRIEIDLGQEPGLEIAERPLDLAFAGGVTWPAHLQRQPVVTGELQHRWMPPEAAATELAELPHPIRPPDRRDPVEVVEPASQALQRVGLVDRRGEPPAFAAAPAQHRPEAMQLMVPAPAAGPPVAVRPVELELLTRRRVDRHRHRRRPAAQAAAHVA